MEGEGGRHLSVELWEWSRCREPVLSFKAVSMARPIKEVVIGEVALADRTHFKPRGREHGFSLNA
jgi:hypothetical protein